MPEATSRPTSLEARIPGIDPRLVRFFRAWQAIRRGAPAPRKREFDPMQVAPLLGYIWLYRFEPGIDDFVCSLAGEEVNDAWDGSIKGRRLRDIVGATDHPVVLQRWKLIVGTPLVHYGTASERMSAQETRRAERLIVPLAGDDGTVTHTLGISLYRFGLDPSDRPALVPDDIVQIPCAEL